MQLTDYKLLSGKTLMPTPTPSPRAQGSAIWFVLLAVALLAALTMTMTRSSDTVEQSGDAERARISASDLMRYTGGIKAAIDRMMLTGISESDLCFHAAGWGNGDYNGASCTDSANQVFGSGGGAVTFRTYDFASEWMIFGSHAVLNLETAAPELIMQARVSALLCREINNVLNIDNPGSDAPADIIQNATPFTGSYTLAAPDNTIGNNAAQLAGKEAGCRKDGASYYFYQVLIKR